MSRAIWNYIAREHGIETVNPFANMNYGNAKAPVKRMPIPIEDIHRVQKLCFELDDDIRWIIAAVSDSGMRLAEVIGLTAVTSTSMKRCLLSDFQSIRGGV